MFTEKLVGVHCTHGLNRTGELSNGGSGWSGREKKLIKITKNKLFSVSLQNQKQDILSARTWCCATICRHPMFCETLPSPEDTQSNVPIISTTLWCTEQMSNWSGQRRATWWTLVLTDITVEDGKDLQTMVDGKDLQTEEEGQHLQIEVARQDLQTEVERQDQTLGELLVIQGLLQMADLVQIPDLTLMPDLRTTMGSTIMLLDLLPMPELHLIPELLPEHHPVQGPTSILHLMSILELISILDLTSIQCLLQTGSRRTWADAKNRSEVRMLHETGRKSNLRVGLKKMEVIDFALGQIQWVWQWHSAERVDNFGKFLSEEIISSCFDAHPKKRINKRKDFLLLK